MPEIFRRAVRQTSATGHCPSRLSTRPLVDKVQGSSRASPTGRKMLGAVHPTNALNNKITAPFARPRRKEFGARLSCPLSMVHLG
jgi:nucleoside diphosphate kinase